MLAMQKTISNINQLQPKKFDEINTSNDYLTVVTQPFQDDQFADLNSDDSTIQEEAKVNESQIRAGEYNSVMWNQYQVEMHLQDLIQQIE